MHINLDDLHNNPKSRRHGKNKLDALILVNNLTIDIPDETAPPAFPDYHAYPGAMRPLESTSNVGILEGCLSDCQEPAK